MDNDPSLINATVDVFETHVPEKTRLALNVSGGDRDLNIRRGDDQELEFTVPVTGTRNLDGMELGTALAWINKRTVELWKLSVQDHEVDELVTLYRPQDFVVNQLLITNLLTADSMNKILSVTRPGRIYLSANGITRTLLCQIQGWFDFTILKQVTDIDTGDLPRDIHTMHFWASEPDARQLNTTLKAWVRRERRIGRIIFTDFGSRFDVSAMFEGLREKTVFFPVMDPENLPYAMIQRGQPNEAIFVMMKASGVFIECKTR